MATAGSPEAGAAPTNDPTTAVVDGAAETKKTWSDTIKTMAESIVRGGASRGTPREDSR